MTDRILPLTYLPEQNSIYGGTDHVGSVWRTFLANQYLHTVDQNNTFFPFSVAFMFRTYNKRAIFDDNMVDDVSLFQKVTIKRQQLK